MIKRVRFLSLMLVLALLLPCGESAQALGTGKDVAFSYVDNRYIFSGDTVFFIKPSNTGDIIQILDMNPGTQQRSSDLLATGLQVGEKMLEEPVAGMDPDLVKLAWIAAAFATWESYVSAETNSKDTLAIKAAAEAEAEAAERLHFLLLAYLPNVLGADLAQAVNDAIENADPEAASFPHLLTLFLSSESTIPLMPDDSVCDAAMNAVKKTFSGVYDPLAFVAAFVAASQVLEKGEDSMTEAATAAAQAAYDSRIVEVDTKGLKLKLTNNAVVFMNSAMLISVEMGGNATLIANDCTIEKGTLGGYAKLVVYDSALKKTFIADKATAIAVDSDVGVAFLLGKGAAYGIENLQRGDYSANESKATPTGAKSEERYVDTNTNADTDEEEEADCGCRS